MSKQLGGLSNTAWVVVIVAVVLGFFMALNEDWPTWINVIGWVILGTAVVGWFMGWNSQGKSR